jgi:hypothetical protein
MAKIRKMGRELKQRHLGWLIVIVLGVCLGLTFPVVAAIWPEEPPPTNHPPNRPNMPLGPAWGHTGVSYTYSTWATDPDGDRVQYRFDWDDGTPISSWTSLVKSGSSAGKSHTWTSARIYNVAAQAMDEHGAVSSWSVSWPVVIMVTDDDANDMEVGVEWVNDYPDWIGNDLSWTDDSAEGFYNILVHSLGWTGVFDRGDGDAWEMDFEKPTVGGRDHAYADDVDFAFFCGHGSPGRSWFGTDHDGDGDNSFMLDYTEAEWGDKDLEWIALATCETLAEDGVYETWGPAFRGLHAMFGYATVSYDVADGLVFAEYLRDHRSWSIGDCWVNATCDTQPPWYQGAALTVFDPIASRLEFWDHLPGSGGWIGMDITSPLEHGLLYYQKWQC